MTPNQADPAVDLVIVIQEALNTPGASVVAIARRFLDAYAAQERERCAQVAEEYIDNSEASESTAITSTVRSIADAIRALS